MPANEAIPYKKPGDDLTFKATAAVTGKRFVRPSGNRTGGPGLSADLANVYQCAHAAAGERAIGVAKYDTANGALGGAYTGGVVPVAAGGTIAAGAEVQADATGQAIALAAGKSLGVALSGATNGQDCEVLLNLG